MFQEAEPKNPEPENVIHEHDTEPPVNNDAANEPAQDHEVNCHLDTQFENLNLMEDTAG